MNVSTCFMNQLLFTGCTYGVATWLVTPAWLSGTCMFSFAGDFAPGAMKLLKYGFGSWFKARP